jgi:uncharacterized protein YndB with AHSA1/START domain
MRQQVQVSALVKASAEKVWGRWTQPAHITQWNQASEDWHSPRAESDLRVGGQFTVRMESRDGAQGFDFRGTYTAVEAPRHLAYTMDDGRKVTVEFSPEDGGTRVTETFEAEDENPAEMQRAGWQAILDSFAAYAERA